MCNAPHSHGCASCAGAHSHPHGDAAVPAWHTGLRVGQSVVLLVWGMLANPLPAFPWAIYVCAYLPVGLPVVREAVEEMRRGDFFNEFTLMLIATAGAFAVGEYPEAVAVMLFYAVGEYFQDRAVGRARRDIRALVSLRPDKATVVQSDGSLAERQPEAVAVGEVVEVRAGERVPVDGKLLTACADFDTAALTGEAVPRSVAEGEEVLAGMIALGRAVRIEVIRPYAQSSLQRILDMVQDAAARKSRTEQFIRRFARVYTPVIIALALMLAVVPWLLGSPDPQRWLYRACLFLVVSCPCALVVSVPLGYFRGIGEASRKGILFKGGNFLDAVTRLRCVVFDKTGTLTTGRFAVTAVQTAPGFDAEKVVRSVAALECHSTHPIGRAIVEKAGTDRLPMVSDVEETAGMGLHGKVDGAEVLAGKAAQLRRCGIPFPTGLDVDEAATQVYVAIGGSFAGVISLGDVPRPDASEAVSRLRGLGIAQTCILSGDREKAVARLARQLGIPRFFADLLPEGKVEAMQRLKRECAPGGVAFVGDGINDAPVLALSDVAFAMGGAGSDAAVETADVVIQGDAPSRVADAILIGGRTRRVVRLNLWLALGVKAVVLAAGALGLVGMWAAVVADTGVTLLCVAHTYRIKA